MVPIEIRSSHSYSTSVRTILHRLATTHNAADIQSDRNRPHAIASVAQKHDKT